MLEPLLSFLSPPASVLGIGIRMLVAVAFTGAAAYYDIFNKKWVPDALLWCFLAASILLNIIFFDSMLFSQAVFIATVIAALSYALYRMGQLGGADVFAMASIALAIPYLPKPLLAASQAIPYPFFLSVLAPTGIAFILHMLCRFIPYVSRQLAKGKVKFTLQKVAGPALVAVSLLIFGSIVSSLPISLPASYFAIIGFLGAALIFFSLFMPEIKASMVEKMPVANLQCEDVLALEQMPALSKKLRLSPVISEKAIAALKRAKIKSVPVYTGMPFFLPYLFIGLVFTLLFGDLLYYLAMGF
ncbi:MAG: prepilin peptidase [Candidatus Micrarchaeia archaeon]